MNIWERFDNIASKAEIEESKSKFTPIEEGSYTMVLEEITPSESKSGLPMLKGKFRTSTNRVVFYNQMLQNINNPAMTAVNIAEAIKFVEGLTGEEVEFSGLSDLANVVASIPTGVSYKIKISYGNKDTEKQFPKLAIEEKLEDAPF